MLTKRTERKSRDTWVIGLFRTMSLTFVVLCVLLVRKSMSERENLKTNYPQVINYHVNVFEPIRHMQCLVRALLVYMDDLYLIT